jgi:heat shock protein HtpX
MTGPSLRGRFAAAIALTVGFYALALTVVGALLALAIVPWVVNGHSNVFVTASAALFAVTILVAIFPRRGSYEAPGVRITAADQPRLLALIEDEARGCGERPPDEVYATLEANAGVTEIGRGRRVMIVGLPLLHLLSERGFRAVIAHEFGHYAGGDTRLGPWIYRTREAIGRTIEHLSDDDGDDSWSQRSVRLPFIWYGNAFLRVTKAISRRQEFAADALAARRTGRDVHVETLRRVHAYGPAFASYWTYEVATVLRAGRRPPVVEGFAAFLRSDRIERAAAEELQRELAEGVTDPYDSHPALAERIAAVEALPPGEPDTSPPATALLQEPRALEPALIADLFGAEGASELRPLEWADVGREIYVERARWLADTHGDLLGASTVGELGDLAADLGRLAAELRERKPELPPEVATGMAATLLEDTLLLALDRHGWAIDAPPGEPVTARHGDRGIVPREVVDDLREGRLIPGAWRTRATALGIAGARLHEPADERVAASL